jgi:hypothetical protein
MGLPSCFLEKKFVKHEKGDDITPFDGSPNVWNMSLFEHFFKGFSL